MIARPRLTMQLTPLLDLLLIVIFAQYMEVRETVRRAEASSSAALTVSEQQRRAAETQLQRLAERWDADRQRWNALQARLTSELETARAELLQASRSGERAARQRDLLADFLRELLRLPDEAIERAIEALKRQDTARSAADLEAVRRRLHDLRRFQRGEVVEHAATFEELRKRCDIWELHVEPTGHVRFTANGRTHRFLVKAPSERFAEKDDEARREEIRQAAERVADELFQHYKTLPQPKSVVVMLVTYSSRITYFWKRQVLDGLQLAADRMRADANGRTRFDYAILGDLYDALETSQP